MSVSGLMIYGCGTVSEITTAFGGTVPDRTIGFQDNELAFQSVSNSWIPLNGAYTPPAKVFANPTRSLNTAFQPSSTRDAHVSYAVDISVSLSLSGGATGTVTLEYADDSGFTTNVVSVNSSTNGTSGTLTLGLGLTQLGTVTVDGIIPAGKYVKLVTANTTGTPTFTFRSAQEVLF